MNTRKPLFADWRVREAMIQAFNFEFINQTLTGGVQPRIQSYFSQLDPRHDARPARRRARNWRCWSRSPPSFCPARSTAMPCPSPTASEANRKGIRAATKLLEEAGWTVQDGVLKNAEGTPFAFEILLTQGADDMLSRRRRSTSRR